MKVTHNTQYLEYRNPFGAVETGTEVLLAVKVVGADNSPLWRGGIAEGDDGVVDRPPNVQLRLWDNGVERLIPMERADGASRTPPPTNDEAGACFVGDDAHIVPAARTDDIRPYNVSEGYGEIVGDAALGVPSSKDGIFYTAKIKCEKPQLLWYYFKIDDLYFGANQVLQDFEPESFQITVYDKNYRTPEWWREQVVYQIFVDRFARGADKWRPKRGCEDYIYHENWDEEVADNKSRIDFYGGNLLGIIEKLDYLQDLGVTCLYLNPIFEAHSNHKYDTADYMKIDSMFGDEEIFRRLCAEAAARGISVILDGVFNHTGSDSIYFNKHGNYDSVGAFQSKDSPYFEWFRFEEWPHDYECWWGLKNSPHVNELCPSYLDYMVRGQDSVVRHWMKCGARGWRLDVADELPGEFIQALRAEAKAENPEAVLIGEVWEDASNKVSYGEQREYLLGRELDGVLNYPFKNAILGFLKGEITAFEFNAQVSKIIENYPRASLYSSMNMLGNHDTARIRTVLGDDRLLKLAVTWQMTFPGVPCVYYGDEAGLSGEADPYNRRSFPWGKEDLELQATYKNLIKMRKENADLISGGYEFVPINDDVLGYKRGNILILLNRSEQEQHHGDIKLAAFEAIVYDVESRRRLWKDQM